MAAPPPAHQPAQPAGAFSVPGAPTAAHNPNGLPIFPAPPRKWKKVKILLGLVFVLLVCDSLFL